MQGGEPAKAGGEQVLTHLGNAAVSGRREMVQERMLPTHPPCFSYIPHTHHCSRAAARRVGSARMLPVPSGCLAQLLLSIPTPRTALLEKSQPGAADVILRKAGKPSSPTAPPEDPVV